MKLVRKFTQIVQFRIQLNPTAWRIFVAWWCFAVLVLCCRPRRSRRTIDEPTWERTSVHQIVCCDSSPKIVLEADAIFLKKTQTEKHRNISRHDERDNLRNWQWRKFKIITIITKHSIVPCHHSSSRNRPSLSFFSSSSSSSWLLLLLTPESGAAKVDST